MSRYATAFGSPSLGAHGAKSLSAAAEYGPGCDVAAACLFGARLDRRLVPAITAVRKVPSDEIKRYRDPILDYDE
jgi:hypothetical protein